MLRFSNCGAFIPRVLKHIIVKERAEQLSTRVQTKTDLKTWLYE